MMNRPDKLFIRDLKLDCLIGTFEHEREQKQSLLFNLCLECDLRPAGRSDELSDTVDYFAIRNAVAECVESSAYNLLEKLAEEICARCLLDSKVSGVTLHIQKNGCLEAAAGSAIEIYRTRR